MVFTRKKVLIVHFPSSFFPFRLRLFFAMAEASPDQQQLTELDILLFPDAPRAVPKNNVAGFHLLWFAVQEAFVLFMTAGDTLASPPMSPQHTGPYRHLMGTIIAMTKWLFEDAQEKTARCTLAANSGVATFFLQMMALCIDFNVPKSLCTTMQSLRLLLDSKTFELSEMFLPAFFRALNSFSDNADVQFNAMALFSFVDVKILSESTLLHGYVESLVRTLRYHKTNENVAFAALSLLARICTDSNIAVMRQASRLGAGLLAHEVSRMFPHGTSVGKITKHGMYVYQRLLAASALLPYQFE